MQAGLFFRTLKSSTQKRAITVTDLYPIFQSELEILQELPFIWYFHPLLPVLPGPRSMKQKRKVGSTILNPQNINFGFIVNSG